jgi:DNA-directed RNA polymerase specialized sigma24 family protein
MDFRNEHHPLHQTDIADERLGVEEIIELKENDTLVREGLHRLLPKERDLLLRYYSNEWFALQEREQLAKQMNIPLAHLRVQVQRTREKLAKHVKGRLKSGSDKR